MFIAMRIFSEGTIFPLPAKINMESKAPVIDKIFPLDEAISAHKHLESGEHMGKIILSL